MYETECDDIFAAFGVRVSMNIMTGICYLIKFPTKQSFFIDERVAIAQPLRAVFILSMYSDGDKEFIVSFKLLTDKLCPHHNSCSFCYPFACASVMLNVCCACNEWVR